MSELIDSLHLTPDMIARWWARQLSDDEVLVASDHLEGCEACVEALARPRSVALMAQVVARDLDDSRAPLVHPTAEGIAGWVDATLDPVEREVVTSHLAVCELCRAEAGDLRGLAVGLGEEESSHSRTWLWSALAASLAMAIVAAWIMQQPAPPGRASREVPSGLQVQAPVPVPPAPPSLRDGPLVVSQDGLPSGIDARWSPGVLSALRQPKLVIPPVAMALAVVTKVPKAAQPGVAALLRMIFLQQEAEAVRQQAQYAR